MLQIGRYLKGLHINYTSLSRPHYFHTKHDFLDQLNQTSKSLSDNVITNWQKKSPMVATELEYKIDPGFFLHEKNSQDLLKISAYVESNLTDLSTREKSIIFKILSIVNKNVPSGTLLPVDLIGKLEENLYDKFKECRIVDFNNICEGKKG